jgi:hypothetical protein
LYVQPTIMLRTCSGCVDVLGGWGFWW